MYIPVRVLNLLNLLCVDFFFDIFIKDLIKACEADVFLVIALSTEK